MIATTNTTPKNRTFSKKVGFQNTIPVIASITEEENQDIASMKPKRKAETKVL